VVLNDNEMSISENVGALNHLAQLLSGKLYSTLREGGKKVFSGVPPIKELLKRTEEHIKGWWCRARCLKSWALTTSARWTATMCSVWSAR
jgi:1-deoxy-D-xylulose-5-phosphate synthase